MYWGLIALDYRPRSSWIQECKAVMVEVNVNVIKMLHLVRLTFHSQKLASRHQKISGCFLCACSYAPFEGECISKYIHLVCFFGDWGGLRLTQLDNALLSISDLYSKERSCQLRHGPGSTWYSEIGLLRAPLLTFWPWAGFFFRVWLSNQERCNIKHSPIYPSQSTFSSLEQLSFLTFLNLSAFFWFLHALQAPPGPSGFGTGSVPYFQLLLMFPLVLFFHMGAEGRSVIPDFSYKDIVVHISGQKTLPPS